MENFEIVKVPMSDQEKKRKDCFLQPEPLVKLPAYWSMRSVHLAQVYGMGATEKPLKVLGDVFSLTSIMPYFLQTKTNCFYFELKDIAVECVADLDRALICCFEPLWRTRYMAIAGSVACKTEPEKKWFITSVHPTRDVAWLQLLKTLFVTVDVYATEPEWVVVAQTITQKFIQFDRWVKQSNMSPVETFTVQRVNNISQPIQKLPILRPALPSPRSVPDVCSVCIPCELTKDDWKFLYDTKNKYSNAPIALLYCSNLTCAAAKDCKIVLSFDTVHESENVFRAWDDVMNIREHFGELLQSNLQYYWRIDGWMPATGAFQYLFSLVLDFANAGKHVVIRTSKFVQERFLHMNANQKDYIHVFNLS